MSQKTKEEASKLKVDENVLIDFHSPTSVYLLDFSGSSIGTISPWESKLAMF